MKSRFRQYPTPAALCQDSEKSRLGFRAIALLGALIWLGLSAACQPKPLVPVMNRDRVQRIENVRYFEGAEKDAQRHSLDLYLPETKANWPVAVVVHGGAWVVNDKSVIGNVGYALANAGVATACINYRLFPRAHHPAQVRDVARAVCWALRNMGEYGADTRNFFLIGYSSGALLAALAALEPTYLAEQGISGDPIRGVVVISGVYDVAIVPVPLRMVFTDRPEVWKEASPLSHVHAGTPPFLILYAQDDLKLTDTRSIKAQSHVLKSALKGVGTKVRLFEIPHANHDTLVEQVGRRADSTTLKHLLDFMDENISPQGQKRLSVQSQPDER